MHSELAPLALNLLPVGVGGSLAFCGWIVLRVVRGSWPRWSVMLLLDIAVPFMCFVMIAAATSSPIFAGAMTFSLAVAYSYANEAKLRVLAEPVVFTDFFLAFDIFRHPRLALPFPNKTKVLLAAIGAVCFCVLMVSLEPPAWRHSPWLLVSSFSLLFLAIWEIVRRNSTHAAKYLRRLGLAGDPAHDSAMFGSLGTLLAYGLIAKGERVARQSAASPTGGSGLFSLSPQPPAAQPIVLVQCESFFDVRRLHAAINSDLLPNFDHCKRTCLQWGRLDVPSWGANTVRTEFAVLSGLSDDALGFDRFDPYYRFAHAPINSLAWQLRAEGYRTICIHPFDPTFYGRNRVMPNLGFDLFLGEEAFDGAARSNGYVSDVEVARKIADLVKTHGPKVFVFAITMENHGPWLGAGELPTTNLLPEIGLPSGAKLALERYVQSLRNADEMLGILTATLSNEGTEGLLAFYGDHLPAFRQTFDTLGFSDLRSDYLIWSPASASAARRDIAARELQAALLQSRFGDVRSQRRCANG